MRNGRPTTFGELRKLLRKRGFSEITCTGLRPKHATWRNPTDGREVAVSRKPDREMLLPATAISILKTIGER